MQLPETTSSQLQGFHRYLTADPAKIAVQEQRKSLCYNLLSKISFVAFLAICAAIFCVALGLTSLPAGFSLPLAGMLISTPILRAIGMSFHEKMLEHREKASIERAIAEELKEPMSQDQVNEFFKEKGIENLNAKLTHEQRHLLIARYQVLKKQITASEDLVLAEVDKEDADARKDALQRFQSKTVPLVVQSAFVLSLATHPYQQTPNFSFKDRITSTLDLGRDYLGINGKWFSLKDLGVTSGTFHGLDSAALLKSKDSEDSKAAPQRAPLFPAQPPSSSV